MRRRFAQNGHRILRLWALIALCLVAGPLRAGEITVFAASSLVDAVTEIAADWEAETGHRAVLSFAATSTLARQIQRGAPADLFIGADPEWLEAIGDRIAARADVAANRLVLIASGPGADSADSVTAADLAQFGDAPIAMALTAAVPAGRYGRAAIEALGAWDGLRVAEAANVRAALALVASGAAPAGVVYASDAAATDLVHVIGIFAADLHPPIRYPAVLLTGGAGDREAARDFHAALQGAQAQGIFAEHGFTRP